MKDQILKIAKVKSEKEFYKKYPTEEAFMKAHGKELKKAAMGKAMVYDQLHQLTDFGNPPKFQGGGAAPAAPAASAASAAPAFGFTKPESFGSGAAAAGMAAIQQLPAIIGGFQAIGAQKKAQKKAEQATQLSGLALQAQQTMEKPKRKYVRPEDALVQPGQLGNPYGSGTNFLAENGTRIGGNPTEIQNIYNPGDMYTDLGFEPMGETLKQYRQGGDLPEAEFGEYFQDSGQAQIGSAVGGAIGSAFGPAGAMIGGLLGKGVGNLLGGAKDARKLQAEKDRASMNTQQAAFAQAQQNQFGAYMEQGGKVDVGDEYKWVSHTWQPQTIAKFGEYNVKDLLKPPTDADMLRSGGHLKDEYYTPPSAEALFTGRPERKPLTMEDGGKFAMGGDLEILEGGKAETISYNPFLPDGGETVMFKGRSHDNGGIPINFGENGVEVEGGEPAVKLKDGGKDNNMVVFGNMKINKNIADLMGDPKAKGRKFKHYVADIAKNDAKQLKRIDKANEMINSADNNSAAGHLTLLTGALMKKGAESYQKINADLIQEAGIVQNAILDTASQLGVKSDKLAEGKLEKEYDKRMMAKDGKKLKKAQKGYGSGDYEYLGPKEEEFSFSDIDTGNVIDQSVDLSGEGDIAGVEEGGGGFGNILKKYGPTLLSTLAPFLRPSNAKEELSPDQLYPEYFALATNQLEPVQAQTFQPMLDTPMDISFNDQLSAIDSQSRAAIRAAGSNPSAQAMIMAQALEAKNQVLGTRDRTNATNKIQTFDKNRAALNEAQLKNLQIFDKQYERQSEAKSRTKELTFNALSSIAAKTAQQRAANRQLAVMENMYNYRFTPGGRAINTNAPAQFNIPGASGSQKTTDAKGNDLLPIYNKKGDITGYKVKEARHGSLVKALKNL
jgi:hypothetical protein